MHARWALVPSAAASSPWDTVFADELRVAGREEEVVTRPITI